MSNELYLSRVKELLADCLDIEDKDELTGQTRFFAEYEVESTEILELTFCLEREYDITIGEGEFWSCVSMIANNGMFDDNGFSEEGREIVHKYFDIPDSTLNRMKSPFDIYNQITINDLVLFIAKKLQ